MKTRFAMCTVAAAAAFTAACSNGLTDSRFSPDLLSAGFESVPAEFSSVQSSYSSTADSSGNHRLGGPLGDDRGHGGPGGHGGRGMGLGFGFGPGGGGLMGGLGGEFFGGMEGGGRNRGPFGSPALPTTCTFIAATGRVTCPEETRGGLTINRSAQYTTASGTVQQAFDTATTDKVNVKATVAGTTTRGDNSTRTVQHSSDRTVSGLAAGSTARTINGASAGTETATGTHRDTAFTSVRVAGDTTVGLVIPVSASGPTYPTAGKVIRHMRVTLTLQGQAPTTSDRREVITYDGSATAKLEITRDGTTTTCTIALPHGRPNCG